MVEKDNDRLVPGNMVALTGLPAGFADDLPNEDRRAILEIVGKTVILIGFDADDRAELQFTATDGVIHFIYVNRSFIKAAK